MDPTNNIAIVLHSDHHSGAHWTYDSVHSVILHRGGKRVHPYRGRPDPYENTSLVVHSDLNVAATGFIIEDYKTGRAC